MFSFGLTWGLNWLRDVELRALLGTQHLGYRGSCSHCYHQTQASQNSMEGKRVRVKCMSHTTVISGHPKNKIHTAPGTHPAHGPQPCGLLLLPPSLTVAAALGPSPVPVADPLAGMLFHGSLMAGLFLTFLFTSPKAGVPVWVMLRLSILSNCCCAVLCFLHDISVVCHLL